MHSSGSTFAFEFTFEGTTTRGFHYELGNVILCAKGYNSNVVVTMV